MSFDPRPSPAATAEHRPVQRYPRTMFSVPVTLRHLATGRIRTTRGISLDISEGGLGAIVQGDLRVGEMVKIDVPIPECPLTAVVIVRHTSSVRSGFEFLGLTAEERWQIANVIGGS
jgi:PilZ domain-containing protein